MIICLDLWMNQESELSIIIIRKICMDGKDLCEIYDSKRSDPKAGYCSLLAQQVQVYPSTKFVGHQNLNDATYGTDIEEVAE